MTKEKLEELIKQEENPKLDFKRDYEEEKENRDYISDIVSIANGNIDNIGETGYLIFGIKEITPLKKEIYGVDTKKYIQDIKRHLAEKLNNYVSPNIKNIDVKDFYFNSKRIIVVIIPFQGSILILKKDIKKTRYKTLNFLYRIGDGIHIIAHFNDSKTVDDFKIKIDKYKEQEKNRQKAEQLKSSGENFEPKREINDEYGSYKNQNGKVALFASLPIIHDYESHLTIECEITFIIENQKKITVTVLEQEILEELFSGYKSSFSAHNKLYGDYKRNWIIFFDRKNNLYTIRIASTTLNVSYKTIRILSDILDDLQEVYVSKLNSIEDRLNSKSFPCSQEYRSGFELCWIDLPLWRKIQNFITKHDYLQKGEWNIFNAYNHYAVSNITVYNKKNKVILELSFKIDNSDILEPKIILIWNTLTVNYSILSSHYMSVEESFFWLENKLIPQIKKDSLKDKQKYRFKFLKKELKEKSKFKIYSLKDELENSNLLSISEKLTSYFYGREVSISKEILIDLYEGLILVIENSKKLEYPYLYQKLSFIMSKQNEYNSDFSSKKAFIEYIEHELREIDKIYMSDINRYTVDHILRCYSITMRDNFEFYPDILIHDIEQKLKGLKEIYDILKIRERRLKYPIYD